MNVADVQRGLLDAQALRSLDGHPGWMILCEKLEEGISKRRERLCDPSCDTEETMTIRLEIRWMRYLLSASKVTDETIVGLERTLTLLRTNEQKRHDYGWDHPIPKTTQDIP